MPGFATGGASYIERWFGTVEGESRKDWIIFVHGPEREGYSYLIRLIPLDLYNS